MLVTAVQVSTILANWLCTLIIYTLVVCIVTPAILAGVLGLSVSVNIILIIVVVVWVTKVRVTSPVPPDTSANEEVKQGTLDIEMKPNSLYDLTSDSIVTKPNEVYRVSVLAEPSQPEAYEYVNP